MSKCLATREALTKAVEQLIADGQTISIRRVHSVIGHGSNEAIAAHLRAILPNTARSRSALLITCLRSRTAAWEQTVEALDQARTVIVQWEDWWLGLPKRQRSRLPSPPRFGYRRRTTTHVRPTDQGGQEETEIPLIIASDRPRRETHFTQDDADRLPPAEPEET